VNREKSPAQGSHSRLDKLLAQVRRVLNDPVALVKMNDRGPFAGAGGLAEKAMDSVIDANWTKHGVSP